MRIIVYTNDVDSEVFYLRIGRYKTLFAKNGVELEFVELSDSKAGRLKQYLQSRKYDVVILAGVLLGSVELAALRKCAKKLISEVSGWSVGKELLAGGEDKFNVQMKYSDLVVASHDFLASLALKNCDDVLILPTGVELSRYRRMVNRAYDSKIRLVWIGDHDSLHYLINIAPVLEEIGERYSEVVLRVISDKYFKLKKMEVEPVRKKLAYMYNALSDCDIGIVPMREGRYSKLLDAYRVCQMYAAGLPVIANPIGENAEIVVHEETGLLAQNKDQWLNCLSLLVENLGVGSQYGTTGRAKVRDKYEAVDIGRQLIEVVKEFEKKDGKV